MTEREPIDSKTEENETTPSKGPFFEVLLVFLKLGLTSFGGPVAHLGYFHKELVDRRKWLTENAYADLVALCQFLPGPASSQVGFSVGLKRGGLVGGLAAWVGFTLPSAAVMVGFAIGAVAYDDLLTKDLLRGFLIMSVAVVAQAVWSMAKNLCPDKRRASVAVVAALTILVAATPWTQVAVIMAGGIAGYLIFRGKPQGTGASDTAKQIGVFPVIVLALFILLLVGLPAAARATDHSVVDIVDSFYRTGSLVFGGGHVVLPLIQAEVVPPGWIGDESFLAGYGAAQAVPGPLFTFAAYLGAAMTLPPSGWLGGLIALIAVFLPSLLLVIGVLPFWDRLRANAGVQSALKGTNAAVVGILLAALYNPVWTKGIHTTRDFAIALSAFALLQLWKVPTWAVLGLCITAGLLL
jgi:chromate transporter